MEVYYHSNPLVRRLSFMSGVFFFSLIDLFFVNLFYRWLKSPAFGTWLAQQEQIVQTVLNDPLPSAAPNSAAPNFIVGTRG